MGIQSLRSLLKTVGFAEKKFSCQKNGNSENGRAGRFRREKCQKNGNSEKMRVRMLLSLLSLQYNVLSLCQYQEQRICKVSLFFRMFLKTFPFTKQCSLRSFKSLSASGAEGFRSLGSLPFSEEPKRIRQKSLGSLPKTE